MRLKKILKLSAALSLLAVLITPLSVNAASSVSVNFEPPTYALGNINAQDGWVKTGPFDVEVESNTYGYPSFDTQTLRISNGVTSGSFGDQTFSKPLTEEAGESSAENNGMSGGTRQSHFEAKFSIASAVKTAQQPGLIMSNSPDRGDGSRMSYLRFEDQSDGIHVFFSDYRDVAPFGTTVTANDPLGCGAGDDFTETDIATLNRTVAHDIKYVIDFVDGSRNDVVKIYVDGALKHTGTSWEDYFRYCEGNQTRTVDSLLFRVSGTAAPANLNNGFLVDNVTLNSGLVQVAPPTKKSECKNDGWKDSTSPVFKNQGDCVSYVASNQKANGNPVSNFFKNLF